MLKIAPTARLKNITGSSEARERIADSLHAKAMQMIEDIFDKKESAGEPAIITKKEIKNILKKIFPGVKINLIDSKQPSITHDTQNLKYFDIRTTFSKRWLKPLFQSKSGKKIGLITRHYIRDNNTGNLGSLSHELKHLSVYLGNPKTLAKSLYVKNRKIRQEFYEKFLYCDEINKRNNPISYYSEYLDKLPNLRKEYTAHKINHFFNTNKITGDDRIKTLQDWRYRLKGELDAYISGCNTQAQYIGRNDTKRMAQPPFNATSKIINAYKEGINALLTKTLTKETCENKYNFSEKIEVIEKLLVEEMAKAGHDVSRFSSKNK